MTRKWCLMDLVTDHQTGKLRETAVWSNIAKAAMTWGFCYTIYYGKGSFTELLWIAYGTIALGHEGFARYMNQRQQQLDKDAPKPTP